MDPINNFSTSRRFVLSSLCLVLVGVGCKRTDSPTTPSDSASKTVTVYCSVDEQFARPIIKQFEQETGIEVAAIFDTEAGKTTGLINKIIAEARSRRPRADVFWSGELFGTIRLARLELLVSYDSPAAADIPSRYRDPKHRWNAYAVRGRVIAFDSSKVPPEKRPTRWDQLAEAEIARVTSIANPLFGTTRGHVAAMFALWGEDKARESLKNIHAGGVMIADGNSATVRAVMDGRATFAVTDTDDVIVAQKAGASIDMVYPDLGDGGTLLIPSSVGVVTNGPSDRQVVTKLVDFLISANVERLLAQSDSRNVPVRESLRNELGVSWPAESKVSFEQIADWLEKSDEAVRDILLK